MDKQVIIDVENLGKKYVLGRDPSGGRYTALRDVLAEKFAAPWRALRGGRSLSSPSSGPEEFWALRDVNLQVRRGEVVGIIGRNGAGKSTLLKVLSRITEPTTGRVSLRGRVASLLEVGTGFHPELTGRENIFLNGAILGMHRAEIKAKFDEIVAFAEVERFLDTPVKRYSSGMYVRLAFAVAAHLEPEVLIVDEVLAVGDAEFQKRCLGKMSEVAKGGGRTVIFVSHNMGAIQSLCDTCCYLKSGRVEASGESADIIRMYQNVKGLSSETARELVFSESFKLVSCVAVPDAIHSGDPITIDLTFYAGERNVASEFSVLLYHEYGQRVAIVDIRASETLVFAEGCTTIIRVVIGSVPFVEGRYDMGLWIDSVAVRRECLGLSSFEILPPVSEVAPHERNVRGFVELQRKVEVISSRP